MRCCAMTVRLVVSALGGVGFHKMRRKFDMDLFSTRLSFSLESLDALPVDGSWDLRAQYTLAARDTTKLN